ncbi:MAG: hypothetical protein ACPGN3_12380 [Opitutales bacterium]
MTDTLEHDFEAIRRLSMDEAICLPSQQLNVLYEQAMENLHLSQQIIQWIKIIRFEKQQLARDEQGGFYE